MASGITRSLLLLIAGTNVAAQAGPTLFTTTLQTQLATWTIPNQFGVAFLPINLLSLPAATGTASTQFALGTHTRALVNATGYGYSYFFEYGSHVWSTVDVGYTWNYRGLAGATNRIGAASTVVGGLLGLFGGICFDPTFTGNSNAPNTSAPQECKAVVSTDGVNWAAVATLPYALEYAQAATWLGRVYIVGGRVAASMGQQTGVLMSIPSSPAQPWNIVGWATPRVIADDGRPLWFAYGLTQPAVQSTYIAPYTLSLMDIDDFQPTDIPLVTVAGGRANDSETISTASWAMLNATFNASTSSWTTIWAQVGTGSLTRTVVPLDLSPVQMAEMFGNINSAAHTYLKRAPRVPSNICAATNCSIFSLNAITPALSGAWLFLSGRLAVVYQAYALDALSRTFTPYSFPMSHGRAVLAHYEPDTGAPYLMVTGHCSPRILRANPNGCQLWLERLYGQKCNSCSDSKTLPGGCPASPRRPVCVPCLRCADGSYEYLPCAALPVVRDTVCSQCTSTCPAGRVLVGECGGSNNRYCTIVGNNSALPAAPTLKRDEGITMAVIGGATGIFFVAALLVPTGVLISMMYYARVRIGGEDSMANGSPKGEDPTAIGTGSSASSPKHGSIPTRSPKSSDSAPTSPSSGTAVAPSSLPRDWAGPDAPGKAGAPVAGPVAGASGGSSDVSVAAQAIFVTLPPSLSGHDGTSSGESSAVASSSSSSSSSSVPVPVPASGEPGAPPRALLGRVKRSGKARSGSASISAAAAMHMEGVVEEREGAEEGYDENAQGKGGEEDPNQDQHHGQAAAASAQGAGPAAAGGNGTNAYDFPSTASAISPSLESIYSAGSPPASMLGSSPEPDFNAYRTPSPTDTPSTMTTGSTLETSSSQASSSSVAVVSIASPQTTNAPVVGSTTVTSARRRFFVTAFAIHFTLMSWATVALVGVEWFFDSPVRLPLRISYLFFISFPALVNVIDALTSPLITKTIFACKPCSGRRGSISPILFIVSIFVLIHPRFRLLYAWRWTILPVNVQRNTAAAARPGLLVLINSLLFELPLLICMLIEGVSPASLTFNTVSPASIGAAFYLLVSILFDVMLMLMIGRALRRHRARVQKGLSTAKPAASSCSMCCINRKQADRPSFTSVSSTSAGTAGSSGSQSAGSESGSATHLAHSMGLTVYNGGDHEVSASVPSEHSPRSSTGTGGKNAFIPTAATQVSSASSTESTVGSGASASPGHSPSNALHTRTQSSMNTLARGGGGGAFKKVTL